MPKRSPSEEPQSVAPQNYALVEEPETPSPAPGQKLEFARIIGRSRSLRFTLDAAARAARTDSPVLIRGESGTGKELLARVIHCNSSGRDKPFIILNCEATPRELLDSELCGHSRGSFSDAVGSKKGKVELADQGTLFLDEVSELPLGLQAKLVRMIQQREIETIGAGAPMRVDVRVIAATHRSLQAMMEDGSFREDLYYGLAVVSLELPPPRRDNLSRLCDRGFRKRRWLVSGNRCRIQASHTPVQVVRTVRNIITNQDGTLRAKHAEERGSMQ